MSAYERELKQRTRSSVDAGHDIDSRHGTTGKEGNRQGSQVRRRTICDDTIKGSDGHTNRHLCRHGQPLFDCVGEHPAPLFRVIRMPLRDQVRLVGGKQLPNEAMRAVDKFAHVSPERRLCAGHGAYPFAVENVFQAPRVSGKT